MQRKGGKREKRELEKRREGKKGEEKGTKKGKERVRNLQEVEKVRLMKESERRMIDECMFDFSICLSEWMSAYDLTSSSL